MDFYVLLSAMMPPTRIYSLQQTADELFLGAGPMRRGGQVMTNESACVFLQSLAMSHENV